MIAKIRVLIADDNPVVRMGLSSLLELEGDFEVCGQASSGPEALATALATKPDVTLLDVRMPKGGGLDVLLELAQLSKVLMLTYSDEPAIVSQALRGGATGYLVHGAFETDELAVAIRDTSRGGVRLSPSAAGVLLQGMSGGTGTSDLDRVATTRTKHEIDPVISQRYRLSRREWEIAEEIVLGKSNGEIASALFIEEKTVKNHINRLFAKLGATSRTAAVAFLLGIQD